MNFLSYEEYIALVEYWSIFSLMFLIFFCSVLFRRLSLSSKMPCMMYILGADVSHGAGP